MVADMAARTFQGESEQNSWSRFSRMVGFEKIVFDYNGYTSEARGHEIEAVISRVFSEL